MANKRNYDFYDIATGRSKLIVVVGKDHEKINNYLQYAAERLDAVIWKNPENGLHPIKQCELAETAGIGLTRNFNKGKRLIVFTDSPYFVGHLENLMRGFKYRFRKEVVDKFLTETPDAFINPKEVSIYVFEDGKINQVLDHRSLNINGQTFSKVSDWVTDLHFNMND